jgi:hypothetical protein
MIAGIPRRVHESVVTVVGAKISARAIPANQLEPKYPCRITYGIVEVRSTETYVAYVLE